MLRLHDAAPYGLAASIFTSRRERFEDFGANLRVGNLYANLPTTFSPSILPSAAAASPATASPREGVSSAIQWTNKPCSSDRESEQCTVRYQQCTT
jgi:acyl-CoA reductase-like NAD-dependent aldehyde dehydrogenase